VTLTRVTSSPERRPRSSRSYEYCELMVVVFAIGLYKSKGRVQ